ncbi:hypothetical protein [Gordonia sp. 852002-10350_SCH5691597]|uniref:hypothetical protein n=1 Tax=Gordonia sp. 852002-10350_SCH5691597 TaxID=1834085 RepID=UPI000ADCC073|nr:hypothetical protein [Gordonia sp. 852002-10350_SCH5691597]
MTTELTAAHARPLTRGPDDADLLSAKLVKARKPGQWVSSAIVLVLAAMLVHTLFTNPRFQWDVVGNYFFHDSILRGLGLTLWLTAAVMVCGFALGILLAVMRLSSNPILSTLSAGYVWLILDPPIRIRLGGEG